MKKKITILFFILFSLFIVTGCSKNSEKDDTNVRIVEKSVTEEDKENLLNLIDELSYLEYLSKSFNVNDLTNQEVLQFTSNLVDKVDGVEFSSLEKIAKEYLDFSLEPENIICVTHFNIMGTGGYKYLYDSQTSSFKRNTEHVEHSDGGYYSNVYNRYVSSKKIDDTYEIVVYKAFSELLDTKRNNLSYYASYSDAVKKSNKLFESDNNSVIDKLNSVDEEKLIKYTYTFQLKNGNYVLKSYEIEK